MKLIIFDLDGTLVNAFPAIAKSANYAFRALGCKPQKFDTIKRAVGKGDRHLMVDFVGEQLADKALKIYRSQHVDDLKRSVRFTSGAKSLLNWCRSQGFKLAVASNRPTKFARIILKTLKAQDYFDKVLCADKAPKPKPYPDMLFKICQDLKVSLSDTMFVGDMIIDVECGKRAKIRTVAVATGSNTKKELKELRPYKIIDSIKQIKQELTNVFPESIYRGTSSLDSRPACRQARLKRSGMTKKGKL